MDRNTWLKKQRRQTEMDYDTIWAPQYGEKYGLYANTTHLQFIQKLLQLLPHPAIILDAACGAGRYFPPLLESGHTIVGADQSQGMLDRAKTHFPQVRLEKVGLQEMSFEAEFEGAICMDAMENICPEDWPVVLSNFYRAGKSKGFLYFTVEVADEPHVRKAYLQAKKAGLPVIMGEMPDEICYHYYPSMQLVRSWLKQAELEIIEEAEGDGYHHFLVRRIK